MDSLKKNIAGTFFILIVLILVFMFGNSVVLSETVPGNNTYRVIKIIDGDTIYLDFNNDGIPQQDEKVRLNGIDTFEVKPSVFLDWQIKSLSLTQDEALGLGYLGKEFAKKELLGKYVRAEYTGETKRCDFNRHLMSVYYDNDKNYEIEVLKAGLALVYKKSNIAPQLYQYENIKKIKENAKKTRDFELVLLNNKTGKYHKPTCEYGLKAHNIELIEKPKDENYQKAKCCFKEEVSNLTKATREEASSKIVEKMDKKEGEIQIFFLSPLAQRKAANECLTTACKTLLSNIQNSNKSIDFAIYGIRNQDEIFNALVEAQNKGVKIRWVTDKTEKNENIYSDTLRLMEKLKNVNDDYTSSVEIAKENPKLKFESSAIMHNKFFIFDNERVFTGSTNISDTCLTGFNSNVAILINSKEVAQVFEQEFEQMYSGKFHNSKTSVLNNENIKIGKITVSVYFSPVNKISTTKIIPIIDNAKNYVYVPAFYLTHQSIANALIQAKDRGVDVKIILDETSAKAQYGTKNMLDENNVPVKVEHWKGKMHQKSMIIDDDTLVIGSMNFTKQGENRNDENTLIIKNAHVLTKAYKQHFLELWESIKEKPICDTKGNRSSLHLLQITPRLHTYSQAA